MIPNKSAFIAAVLLAGTAIAANAQQQYPVYAYPYEGHPYYQTPPSTPLSWSYDPYTSGMSACPQRGRRDPPCNETLFPTYGQPNYRR
jgi:hypothetical protein